MARELTKLWETVVRGTLGSVDRELGEPRGEYALVIAGAPDASTPPDDDTIRAALRAELAAGVTTRDAVGTVARRLGVPKRVVYDLAVTESRRARTATLPAAVRPRTPYGRISMSEYSQMMGAGPSAAFFDLDRTLISGSSAFILAASARSAGFVSTGQFARDAGAALRFKLRGASDRTTDGLRDRVLGAVKGMRQDDLIALNAEVLPKLLAKIRPEARRLLDLHRHAGRNTYIVSAAPVEIVESLAHSLGMTAGIGTRGAIDDGVYNGELAGPFCYGRGKVAAMQEIARWDGLDLGQCYAYSDSASDLPMLQAVGHPVAVNPDTRLARHARANGWPIVHFSQRTKSVIRRTATAAGASAIAGLSFVAGTKYARRVV